MAGTWKDLVATNDVGRVVLAFEDTIRGSFADDKSRVTQDEIKRRFELCCKVFERLRGDLGWSIDRALDLVPRYLRCELDGIPYVPDTRAIWTPDAGQTGDIT